MPLSGQGAGENPLALYRRYMKLETKLLDAKVVSEVG